MTFIITILTLLLQTPSVKGYTTIPLTNNPGLYYEFIKEMRVAAEPWTIATVINLQPLLFNQSAILNKLKEISDQCPYSRFTCDHHLSRSKFITEKLDDGMRINQHILDLIESNDYNLRIPPENNQFTVNIDKIHKGKRISSVTSALDIATRKVTSHYTQVQGRYLRTTGLTPKDYYSYVETFLTSLETLADSYNSASRRIMDVVAYARTNQISPDLFPTYWINHFTPNNQPSTSNQLFLYDNLHRKGFSKITNIKIDRNGYNITILMDLPIFKDKSYYVYKLHPVPSFVEQNQFMQIKPAATYLADGLNDYALFDSLDHCLEKATIIYCNQELVFRKDSSCEKELLTSAPSYQDCQYTWASSNKTTWIRLQSTNEWIFSAPQAEQANISCSGYQNSLTIEGTGILQPEDACQLRTYDVTIDLERRNPLAILHYLPKFPLFIPTRTNPPENNSSKTHLIICFTLFPLLIITILLQVLFQFRPHKTATQPPIINPESRELLYEVPLQALSARPTPTLITFRAPSPPPIPSPIPDPLPILSPKSQKRVRIKSDPEIRYLEPDYDNAQISNRPVEFRPYANAYVSMNGNTNDQGLHNASEAEYVAMVGSSDSVCIDIYELPHPPRELLEPNYSLPSVRPA